jgi:uncharacterized tellurite resistance protein B-like protein
MNSYQEKLSILADLISFAQSDDKIHDSEYQFLQTVAGQLGVHEADFEDLFSKTTQKFVPKNEADRILQFHRLILLMNVDQEQKLSEMAEIRTMGLMMGLPPTAIDQVLVVMHQYPHKIVPPEVLIDIFKTYYN